MTYLLECNELVKNFDSVNAVDHVNMAIHSGEFVTLLGPSGCGKSTTLRLIAGFEQPNSGTITLNHQIVAGNGGYLPPEKRKIGMVFQDYALFPHLSVADNVSFGLKGDKSTKRKRTAEMLELVGLAGYDKRMPYELSGGQQQRVALARALAPAPELILLDEPFSNLDAALRAQVRGEVRNILKQAKTTCLFVTHDQEEALSLSDRIAVMMDGTIAQFDQPHVVYQNPVDRHVASFIGEGNYIRAQANGDIADCVLGQVRLRQPEQGSVLLMLRPEAFALSEDGVIGRVVWHEYYGHDQRLGVELDNQQQLIVLDHTGFFSVGDTIRLQVRGMGVAFPLT
jgi:iron(III) transport system ATP-binding protein